MRSLMQWFRSRLDASPMKGQKTPVVRKPVFIIGCGRAGTTLLFQILQQHPKLAPTTGYPDGEDHEGWVRHGQCIISGLGNVSQDPGVTGYHYCLHMTEEDADPDIVANMHKYYFSEVFRGDSAKRVLNKCPHLSNKLRYVRAIFPDAVFIHVVRDCLPTVFSWIKMMQTQKDLVLHWPSTEFPCFWVMPAEGGGDSRARMFRHEGSLYPGGGVDRLVDYWIETNRNIPRQLADTPSQLLTIRYEDFISDPLSELNRAAEFCELDELFTQVPESLTCGPIESERNAEYNNALGADRIARWMEMAVDVRRQFGYV